MDIGSIFAKDLRNGKVEEFTNLSLNGVIEVLKLSADGKRMGIMMTTPITPSDIYLIDIGKDKDDNNNVQKITHSLLGNIPENLLIRPDLIRYKGFDGLEISAFLYKPKEEIVNNRPQKFGVYYQFMVVLQLKRSRFMIILDFISISQITD